MIHVEAGLERDAAAVEGDPLADEREHRVVRAAGVVVAVMADTDQPRRPRRSRADTEEQVVAAVLQLRGAEDLELEVVALGDPHRLLRERVGRELVRRRVLPLPASVGRLAVLLRGHDLGLAPGAVAGEQQLVDLASLGGGARLA